MRVSKIVAALLVSLGMGAWAASAHATPFCTGENQQTSCNLVHTVVADITEEQHLKNPVVQKLLNPPQPASYATEAEFKEAYQAWNEWAAYEAPLLVLDAVEAGELALARKPVKLAYYLYNTRKVPTGHYREVHFSKVDGPKHWDFAHQRVTRIDNPSGGPRYKPETLNQVADDAFYVDVGPGEVAGVSIPWDMFGSESIVMVSCRTDTSGHTTIAYPDQRPKKNQGLALRPKVLEYWERMVKGGHIDKSGIVTVVLVTRGSAKSSS